MHLTKNGTNNIWGGSVNYWGNSELSNTKSLHVDTAGSDVYFYYKQDFINDYVSTDSYNMHAFCQANPFNLNW